VGQCGGRACLAKDAAHALRIVRPGPGSQHLERHGAIERQTMGAIDVGHAARAERRFEPEAADESDDRRVGDGGERSGTGGLRQLGGGELVALGLGSRIGRHSPVTTRVPWSPIGFADALR